MLYYININFCKRLKTTSKQRDRDVFKYHNGVSSTCLGTCMTVSFLRHWPLTTKMVPISVGKLVKSMFIKIVTSHLFYDVSRHTAVAV